MRILDRYVLRQFLKIFFFCVLGVPFLFIVIDLTDNLDTFLAEGATKGEVALHYVYQLPYQALLAFPIASLLAAVFTVSSMTRHFEITAAKAGGVSFYRLAIPLLLASLGISGVALFLTEVVPTTNRMAEAVMGGDETRTQTIRSSFVYRADQGRVYRARRLDARRGRLTDVRVEREGSGSAYPTYSIFAPAAEWDSASRAWVLQDGRIWFFPDRGRSVSFRFDELRQRQFRETPEQLLADPKEPEEMRYGELGRFIEAIKRSGGTARKLEVERALKISFPFACFIIVLFGTPLAHTTRKGGPTLSIGIALAVTIFFLMLIRIAQGLGAGGVVPPQVAAWLPNLLFLTAGLVLLSRVRT